jgi:hypothetical protein
MAHTETWAARWGEREQLDGRDRSGVSRRAMTGSVEDRRHFPRQRKGCYYERFEDCCWLCMARFAIAGARSGSEGKESSERDATGSNRPSVRDGGE